MPLRLSTAQWAKMQVFWRRLNPRILPSPDETAIAARVQELTAMGLRDEPTYEGLSSSVRQYAINSLGTDDGEEIPFMITTHEGLLALASRLQERYGMRPVTIAEAVELSNQEASKS